MESQVRIARIVDCTLTIERTLITTEMPNAPRCLFWARRDQTASGSNVSYWLSYSHPNHAVTVSADNWYGVVTQAPLPSYVRNYVLVMCARLFANGSLSAQPSAQM